jgi:hypothetical protein
MCKTKFNKDIDGSVIDDVKEEVRRLSVPKEITMRKVLIYSGELDGSFEKSTYFDRTSCVDDLLT